MPEGANPYTRLRLYLYGLLTETFGMYGMKEYVPDVATQIERKVHELFGDKPKSTNVVKGADEVFDETKWHT
jgi:hypothetical protein